MQLALGYIITKGLRMDVIKKKLAAQKKRRDAYLNKLRKDLKRLKKKHKFKWVQIGTDLKCRDTELIRFVNSETLGLSSERLLRMELWINKVENA